MRESLFPEHRIVSVSSKLYSSGLIKLERLMSPLLEFISRIGQGQLIRKQIAYILRLSCHLDAHILYQALDTFNNSLMNDIKQHHRKPDEKNYPTPAHPTLTETTALLQSCGFNNPLDQVKTNINTIIFFHFRINCFLFSYKIILNNHYFIRIVYNLYFCR